MFRGRDDRRARGYRGLDLSRIGVDEQRDPHPRGCQTLAGPLYPRLLSGNIQAPLGGQLGAPLGHQAAVARTQTLGYRQDLFSNRHFQIQTGPQGLLQEFDVAFLDVTTIFPQMCGNGIGAGAFRNKGRLQRIRVAGSPRLAQRRDMIDIHT